MDIVSTQIRSDCCFFAPRMASQYLAAGGLYVGIFTSEYAQQLLLRLEGAAMQCLSSIRNAVIRYNNNDAQPDIIRKALESINTWSSEIRHQETQFIITQHSDMEPLYKAVILEYVNQLTQSQPMAAFFGRSGEHRKIHIRYPPFNDFYYSFLCYLCANSIVQSLDYFYEEKYIERKIAAMDAVRRAVSQCIQGRIQYTLDSNKKTTTTSNNLGTTNQSPRNADSGSLFNEALRQRQLGTPKSEPMSSHRVARPKQLAEENNKTLVLEHASPAYRQDTAAVMASETKTSKMTTPVTVSEIKTPKM
ncbi:MAG: hypothetical protein KGL95_09735, partial [Patescibacteria group bacterium]|nr:hypothetical protein [Patescibacteria group bacterium]